VRPPADFSMRLAKNSEEVNQKSSDGFCPEIAGLVAASLRCSAQFVLRVSIRTARIRADSIVP
jgi:hypothetical protein